MRTGGRGKAEEKRRRPIALRLLTELRALGLRPHHSGFYQSEIDTRYGLLNVTIDLSQSDRGGSFCSVFTRFDEPDRAKGKLAVPCNPYSGKWNFHSAVDTRDAESVDQWIGYVVRSIAAVALPKEQEHATQAD